MTKLLNRLRAYADSLFNAKKDFITDQNSPVNYYRAITANTYIAPMDGFVRSRALATSDLAWLNCGTSVMFYETGFYAVNSWSGGWLRVRKGDTCTFQFGEDTTSHERYFIPCMGGGGVLKETAQLLQGGFVCLKASLKQQIIATAESFCRQETIVFMKRFLSVKRKALTLCLMMVSVCLPATVCSLRLKIKRAVEQSLCTQAKATSFIKQRVSLAQKAIKLSGSFGNTKAAQQLCIFSILALIKANYRKEAVYG